jgi:hypothetical protein
MVMACVTITSMPARKKPEPKPVDPDDVVRESAGTYRSGDRRFEVRQSEGSWYVVDLERTNDFGQELIHGPFETLKESREAIPGARKVTPLPRRKPTAAARQAARESKPAPPPKTWIDRLPEAEADTVRRAIRALEGEGVPDAEDLVRASRKEGGPGLASAVIERRLRALVDESAPDDRRQARELVRRVANILTEDGALTPKPLPRWALVEFDAGEETPRRLRPKV